jgi:HAE1 family hydrophobic/amphiphilic exporter-1
MSLSAKVINRPTTVVVIFTILVGMALYLLPHIAINLFPDTEIPMIVVRSSYTGAGPEEMEQNVTKVLEGQLSNVGGLVSLTSTSSEGSSFIMLEFAYGSDLDTITNDIRDKLEPAGDMLPDDADSPVLFKMDPNSMPIMNLVVKGERSLDELRVLAEDMIESRIERIDGVSSTSIRGGREKIIRVEISQNRLQAYGMTLTQIAATLAAQNVQLGAGEIDEGGTSYTIRTNGQFGSIGEMEDTVLTSATGADAAVRVVRLRDVAAVFEGFEDSENTVFINGQPGLYLAVMKESGTNSASVADSVKNRLADINRTLPEGVSLEVISDTTKMIRDTINNIYTSLVIGIVLAVLVLLPILRNLKSALIIGLSIPISILITIMFMYFFNLTLNIMTLTGLVLALGMVVDCSIVIVENIFRYRERGTKLKSAALLGTREMITAITASTVTTICVFIPIIIFKNRLEMLGQLFEQLGLTIIIALIASLAIAITLVPVLASKFLPLHSRKQKPLRLPLLKKVDGFFERVFQALERGYTKALTFALRNKALVIILVVVILVLTGIRFLSMGISMFPMMSEDSVTVSIELPVGATLERTEEVLDRFQDIVKSEIKGYKDLIVTAGGGSFMSSGSSYKGSIEIVLPELGRQQDSMFDVRRKLRARFNDIPGAVCSFAAGRGNIGNTNPVDILVQSDDLDKAKRTAERIRDLIRSNLPRVTEPAIDLSEGLPQYVLAIDRERAHSLGVSVYKIAYEVNACVRGTTATQYRSNGKEEDVLVILEAGDREAVPDLDNIFVLNGSGKQVRISDIARFVESTGPISIKREDEVRTVHVTGGLAAGYAATSAGDDIKALVAREMVADDDVSINYGGDIADIQSSGTLLVVIIIMAIVLVFGVMASLFESLLDPFIVFLSIPLMFIGVVWLYALLGANFSMMSAVGLVLLVGIVVNNGIVLVDYTNLLRERGRTIFNACVEAGGNRLRPILGTSLTTILGMVPMAFFPGQGSEMVQPIGQTVVGGLVVSTLMTLFLTPVLYAVFNRRHKNNRKKEREEKLLIQMSGGEM